MWTGYSMADFGNILDVMTKTKNSSGFASAANKFRSLLGQWQRFLPLGLAFGLPQILRAENHVDYRYEYYAEENNRMTIETHSVYFEQKLSDALVAKGEMIYDGISGASPSGFYRFNGQVLTSSVHDIRRAGNLALDWKFGPNTLTPGFAYSKENDYESYGISLNDAFEFNDKNTIVQLGASHNFDSVLDSISNSPRTQQDKTSTDIIIGISQLLSPKTILAANFTFGNDSGYLNDPYRVIEYLPPGFFFGIPADDNRPAHRNKEILLTSLTHFIEPLNASIEGSYRFYHDSYGIYANTLGLTWHQWLGAHLIVEPMFRFYEQNAASFYYPGIVQGNLTSQFYSADYRLSEFYSLDYGLQATVIFTDHLRVTGGYHRYQMNGLDATPAAMYPTANILTIGLSISW